MRPTVPETSIKNWYMKMGLDNLQIYLEICHHKDAINDKHKNEHFNRQQR